MIKAIVNGSEFEFDDGVSILGACRSVGVDVPTLCHDERLKPSGGCRMCIVDVAGLPNPQASCSIALRDGMSIETHSEAIEETRRMILRMMAESYPGDAIADAADKPLHRYLNDYGVSCSGVRDCALVDDSHPYIHVDMSQCINCYRCVRICAEVQGQFVWKMANIGASTRVVPDSQSTLFESSCVSCGACVDTCPTGALEDKSILKGGAPNEWTKTTCPYCGTGCEMRAGTRAGRLVQIKPVPEAPVSRGHLCVKGRYAFDFVHAPDRITEPMVRENGQWVTVNWEQAIEFTARRLREIINAHGPDSVGVLGSSRATNEENYLAQKFARVVLDTNNVDCCARVCHAPTAAAMKTMLGTGAATNSFDDIERAGVILLTGANATENHPIVGARIKQAVIKGAKLIVIDPRRIELVEYATIHLQPHPGTNIPLLNSIAHVIVFENLVDRHFVESRVAEFEEFRSFIREWTPERAAGICGVETTAIHDAARLYATSEAAIGLHGLGMTEHTQGTEGVMALVNLALLTGNIGKPGSGVNPLRGQNNVQGSAHMGCEPSSLTGMVSVIEERPRFESVWQTPLPTRRGLNLLEMMDGARDGRFKALWAIGYDLFLTNANAESTDLALRSLELIVVQDMFMTETAREFGHVFLPCTSSFEKDGTFMNSERRIGRVRQAIEPLGGSRADWVIICDLARAMGKGEFFAFRSAEEIWNEVRAVWPAGRGITYERIEKGGLQWPCPNEAHPGTEVLHVDSFAKEQRAALRCVEFLPTEEQTNSEYPFLLTTGRSLYQFNAGTMTARTPNIELRLNDYLDISPIDAQRLNLANDEQLILRSRHGEATLPIRITDSVKPGELFTTFHMPQVFLNRVTSQRRDSIVGSPEYKVTAVNVIRLIQNRGR